MKLQRTMNVHTGGILAIPVVDVLFLLLLFLLLNGVAAQAGVEVTLPEAPFAQNLEPFPAIITVTAEQGRFLYYHDEQLTLAELRQRLESLPGYRSVVIKADAEVNQQRLMQVAELPLEKGHKTVIATAIP